eukprot:Skav202414  [mRNA]  locus=scaffold1370:83330:83882:- [translate_table: standard]
MGVAHCNHQSSWTLGARALQFNILGTVEFEVMPSGSNLPGLVHIFSRQANGNEIAPVVVDVCVRWILVDMQTDTYCFALE